MAELKAGSVNNFANSMAEQIEIAMGEEWALAHPGDTLAGAGKIDRQVMFAAISKGVLRYLHQHLADLETSAVHGNITATHKHVLRFDLEDA